MNVYVTIGGQGTRLKSISPVDKQYLYYGNKRIIEHIFDIFPNAKLLGLQKTASRKETLYEIKDEEDCLIVDCDVIPKDCNFLGSDSDCLYYFETQKKKYGSIVIENELLSKIDEDNNISEKKCSGAYFVKSMNKLLANMTNPNSIASGMIGAKTIKETTFIRLGDTEDYFEAL